MIAFIIWGIVFVALFWYVAIRPMSYWKKKGAKQGNPLWLFGDNGGTLFKWESFADMVVRLYNALPGERYVGIYQFTIPTLMIRDPDLLKQVTVKEFDHFMDHRSFLPEDSDPLWNKNLFALRGHKWREMRPILSPSFTSSKMRSMFVLMSDCVEVFINHFVKKKEDTVEVEMKDILTRFGNDVIASAAFGVKVDSLGEPKNEFYRMGKEATDFSGFWKNMKFFAYLLVPKLCKVLSIQIFSQAVSKFFQELVNETIRVREEKGIVRPDMIHLLMEARKGNNKHDENVVDTGFATVDETEIGKVDVGAKTKEITNVDIAAQALIFFFAGFDSVTTLMSFMAYELALHPDIQERLRHEIVETRQNNGGKLNYEALMKMKYMDMVVSESLRKWPNAVAVDRVCTKPYTIQPMQPGEVPVHLVKDEVLWIPIFGIHRDPKFYPNPDKFDPERFSDENKDNIQPYTFLPFGLGPRNCIASRFALLEAKTLFFHMLYNFEIVPIKKTQIPIKIDRKSFALLVEGGFNLGLKRITRT